jgi:hypothetical protein
MITVVGCTMRGSTVDDCTATRVGCFQVFPDFFRTMKPIEEKSLNFTNTMHTFHIIITLSFVHTLPWKTHQSIAIFLPYR